MHEVILYYVFLGNLKFKISSNKSLLLATISQVYL